MTKDEALKLALEALTNAYWPTESDLMPAHNIKECADAITAIKEALAQPEQEPVADHFDCGTYLGSHIGKEIKHRIENYSPPQRKPLTDEEIILIVAECAASHQHTDIHFARAIERAHGIKELV